MSASFTTKDREFISGLLEEGLSLSVERLGVFTGLEWDIVTSTVDEMPVIQALSRLHTDKTPHFGAHLKGRAILPVEAVILFPEPSAKALTDSVLTKASDALKSLPNPMEAIVAEVSNIMGQAVLKALADKLEVAMILGVPLLSLGLKSEILGSAFTEFDGEKDAVLLSRSDMVTGSDQVSCTIALIFRVRIMRQMIRGKRGA